MGWFSGPRAGDGRSGAAPSLPAGPHRWVVVDVETSGLYPNAHRVLSIAAIALSPTGVAERQVVTLVDAGCDPGPVHVHGLTREILAGSPRFADVLPQLHEVLADRVLVAHNAAFDYRFLPRSRRGRRSTVLRSNGCAR